MYSLDCLVQDYFVSHEEGAAMQWFLKLGLMWYFLFFLHASLVKIYFLACPSPFLCISDLTHCFEGQSPWGKALENSIMSDKL